MGAGTGAQVKIMAVRRQMRTRNERTIGAWILGCVLIPIGGSEMASTAGNGNTATPNILREHEATGSSSLGEPVPDTGPNSLESMKGHKPEVK